MAPQTDATAATASAADTLFARMPRFRGHKEVQALKIASATETETGEVKLVFADSYFPPGNVPADVCSRYMPVAGDYLVRYADGYLSISPGKVFEEGYSGDVSADRARAEDDKVETVASTSDARTANNVMRHDYRVLSDAEKAQMKEVKDAGLDFGHMLEDIGGNPNQPGQTPRMASRELSLAQTKIEEAVMWAVKHITR